MNITLMGAGGKMGCRIADNLTPIAQYNLSYVEVSEAGKERLAKRGLEATAQAEAIANCEVIILALPDNAVGPVCLQLIPELPTNTLVIGLDPAAAYAGVLPMRDDLAYCVAHPCHPPIFDDEVTSEAKTDYFGGQFAKQDIVCALIQGSESDYDRGTEIAKAMYAPVMKAHRVSLEQMAILEPALVETTVLTCLLQMRNAMDKAIEMGVPHDAAKAFMMGHLRVLMAIVFDYADFFVSDGAKLAADQAQSIIFKPDWIDRIMNIEAIQDSVAQITCST